jgi:signal transduction histidine kinase
VHLLAIAGEFADSGNLHQLLRLDKQSELQLTQASNLDDAIRLLGELPIDVVLVDLATLDSRLQTVADLRARCPHVPIVALTNDEDEQLNSDALRRGADDYIAAKDLSFEVLVRTMRYVLERHRRFQAEKQLLETRLAERNRISQELHDGVLQSLNTIRLRLQMLASRVRVFDKESSQRTLQIADSTLETIDELRRVAKNLHSPMLDTQGLVDALTLDAARLEKQFDVQIKVRSNCVHKLPVSEQHHLYRIFQESVHNAIRHGRASDIVVELQEASEGVALCIHDNGSGFDVPSSESASHGLGLSSIRERAQSLGGKATIESAKDCGTTVMIELPSASTSHGATSTMVGCATEPVPQPEAPPLRKSDTVTFSSRDTVEWKRTRGE